MRPLNDRSLKHVTVSPPRPVQVWVNDGVDAPRWCHGELVEWSLYGDEVGWTAWCRYNLAPDQRFNGRFLAANVRPDNDDGPSPTTMEG